jgi:ABC-type glutathione transport system ATPase component
MLPPACVLLLLQYTGLLKQIGGYVMQDDLLNGQLTVEETLQYTAKLRCPPGFTDEQRQARVEQVRQQLATTAAGQPVNCSCKQTRICLHCPELSGCLVAPPPPPRLPSKLCVHLYLCLFFYHQQALSDMGLLHVRGVIVGTPLEKGISGGERKRLCVALELITEPALLFL